MKKLIIALGIGALVLFGCTEQEAEAMEIQNNINVSAGDINASFDQDGNEFSVGAVGLSFSTSDNVRLGIAYDTDFVLGLSGGTSVEYTTDDDFVLGVQTGFEYWGANLDTEILWNINDTEFDAKVGTGYTLFGLDGKVTSNWDIDNFSYEGMDLNAGYTWNVSDGFSVRPNVSVPFDDGFSRGDVTAGVSIRVSFDASTDG